MADAIPNQGPPVTEDTFQPQQVNSVSKITAMENSGVVVSCNVSDALGVNRNSEYVLYETDPYGLAPVLRQWMQDNPDFPIDPYVPPTLAEYRADARPISRVAFRTRLLAAGVNSAAIASYIASQDEQTAILWEASPVFYRLDPFVLALAAYAGKTAAELDTIFDIGG